MLLCTFYKHQELYLYCFNISPDSSTFHDYLNLLFPSYNKAEHMNGNMVVGIATTRDMLSDKVNDKKKTYCFLFFGLTFQSQTANSRECGGTMTLVWDITLVNVPAKQVLLRHPKKDASSIFRIYLSNRQFQGVWWYYDLGLGFYAGKRAC